MPTLSPTQDQHYVPEFLFAPWATDGEVECFGTINGRMVCRSLPPSAFAFQTNLTSVPSLPADKRHFIEDGLYSPLDSDAAKLHRKLVAMPRMEFLPVQESRLWAVFLLSLVTRHPKTVAEGAEAFRRTSRRVMARRSKALRREATVAGHSIKGDLESWARKTLPGLLDAFPMSGVADMALDMANVEAVRGTLWWFIERPAGCPEFLIGTRPLLLRKLGDFPFGRWSMILPISPDRAIMLATGKELFDDLDPLPSQLVRNINIRTILESNDRVIASNRGQKQLIERYFRQAGRLIATARGPIAPSDQFPVDSDPRRNGPRETA